MGNHSANDFFPRAPRHAHSSAQSSQGGPPRGRVPSSSGYLLGAAVAAFTLFLALWWMLVSGGDEAPWIPAGLAASVVLLVAVSAREVVMRRAWTRYLLEHGGEVSSRTAREKKASSGKTHSSALFSASWRNIQRQSDKADSGSIPDLHLDVFHLCQDYLASTEDALRSNNLLTEKRIAIKAGQDRVRGVRKHHLLTWARDSSRVLTFEAQQKARMSEKIEAANRALHCLETAQKYYPGEAELNESSVAIREFVASVKVAHWVELAERSAFKGHYARAIERYKDALFYLNRETMKEDVRISSAERIGREIELLRTRLQEQKSLKAATTRGNKRSNEDEVL